jgi:hypothetical protein
MPRRRHCGPNLPVRRSRVSSTWAARLGGLVGGRKSLGADIEPGQEPHLAELGHHVLLEQLGLARRDPASLSSSIAGISSSLDIGSKRHSILDMCVLTILGDRPHLLLHPDVWMGERRAGASNAAS